MCFTSLNKKVEFRQKYSATQRSFGSLLGVSYVIKHCLSCQIYYLFALAFTLYQTMIMIKTDN